MTFVKKVKHAMDYNGDDNDNESNCDNELFDDIFESQYEYWKLPSEKEMERSRHASKNKCQKPEIKELVKDIQFFLKRIADKSQRLIGNFTTNSWMAITANFGGGSNKSMFLWFYSPAHWSNVPLSITFLPDKTDISIFRQENPFLHFSQSVTSLLVTNCHIPKFDTP
jgi:hypothetical protein